MPRVHEVAKELGVPSREVIAELNALGHPVTSHASSVDADTAAVVKARIGNGAAASAVDDQPAAAHPTPEDDAPPADQPTRPSAWGPVVAPPTTGASEPAPAGEDLSSSEPAGAPVRDRGRSRVTRQLLEIPILVGLAFVIAIVIKTFLAQAFYIPSPSMRPTLVEGDRVLVEKLSYRFGNPDRGDVVVFAKEVFGVSQDLPWQEDVRNFFRELLGLPTGTEEDYIKRVVGVSGDVIRYAGEPRRLTVNGDVVEEPYLRKGADRSSQTLTGRDCERLDMERKARGCIVPAGRVFVMGDNRGNSEDSRVIGPIEEDHIVGRAFVVIWPFRNWSGL
ncbi:MAG TPA: signal peptidase I [Actinomycetota bacterium]|nr:signal peptidase I [Actinomycetota bacterium]